MAVQSVDIYVTEPAPISTPISGVMVRIYDGSGVFVTTSTTDGAGHAGFALESDTYQIRLFKFQTSFTNPQTIEVSDTEPNVFDVVGTSVVPPVATDPNLCRISGYIRKGNGGVAPGMTIHIENLMQPLLLAGSPVLAESLDVRSDRTGYVEFDLIRTGVYEVTLAGMSDVIRNIVVPDAASAPLGALLFPTVSSVVLTPSSPTVAVGATTDVAVVVALSNGNTLVGTGRYDVQWASSDETVFTVAVYDDRLTLSGIATGTAQLTATRKNVTIVGVPELTIAGQPVTVTVT